MMIVAAAVASVLATGAMDVQHYRLDLRVDPASKSLHGVVETRAKLLSAAPTELALDLARALTVDSVTLDGKAADFRRQDDQILVVVKDSPRSGQSLSIAVTYHGTPQGKGFTFAERNGQPAISNYGLPFTARQWWPSKDDPADKADTAEIVDHCSDASDCRVQRQAGRRQITNADGTRTFHWRVEYPIYPDTVSVAIAEYVVFEDRYRASERHGHAAAVLCLSAGRGEGAARFQRACRTSCAVTCSASASIRFCARSMASPSSPRTASASIRRCRATPRS